MNFVGVDTFTFIADDGRGGTSQAAVSVTIGGGGGGVNAPPDAQNVTATTDEDTPVTVTLNATDSNGDPLTFSANPQDPADNGVVTVNSNGTADYIPNVNFNGVDTFGYIVDDGHGGRILQR